MRVSGRRHWMVLRDGTLPTAWLSSRKNSVLRCIERLCAETASEHRRAQRRLQEVEEAMATQNQPGSILPGGRCRPLFRCPGGSLRLRLLKQSCCAGNWRRPMRRSAGMRLACSPTSVPCWTWRRENAELQALCEQARAGETLPEPTPQPTVPVLEKPELPVIHFPAPARDAGVAQGPLPGEIETLLDTGTPEWEPKTKLDHLSVDIISQLEQLMGT